LATLVPYTTPSDLAAIAVFTVILTARKVNANKIKRTIDSKMVEARGMLQDGKAEELENRKQEFEAIANGAFSKSKGWISICENIDQERKGVLDSIAELKRLSERGEWETLNGRENTLKKLVIMQERGSKWVGTGVNWKEALENALRVYKTAISEANSKMDGAERAVNARDYTKAMKLAGEASGVVKRYNLHSLENRAADLVKKINIRTIIRGIAMKPIRISLSDLADKCQAPPAVVEEISKTLINNGELKGSPDPISKIFTFELNSDITAPPIYKGLEPYIFISYSHNDMGIVNSILWQLHSDGFRFWYDPGLSVGFDYNSEIAQRIKNCTCFLLFISPPSMDSEFVNIEIYYALDKKKNILPVYLEKTALPEGIELRISKFQNIRKYELDEESFYEQLESVIFMKECRSAVPDKK
jgi:hypothetical protein